MPPTESERAQIAYLRSPRAIREQATALARLAADGALEHFRLDETRLPAVVDRVLAVMRRRYPDPSAIPYHSRWRHFGAGGVDRLAALDARLAEGGADAREALRARFDLAVTSVLLDAGAGGVWSFREPGTGLELARSEGLAVASFHAFMGGLFSSDPIAQPLRADAAALGAIDERALGGAFGVTPDRPLAGLGGRVALLHGLADAVTTGPIFAAGAARVGGQGPRRVGHLADALVNRGQDGTLPAEEILATLLEALGPIWPGRHRLGGVNLGDVWPHPAVGLVPLHKLSQWLAYSLVEPLEAAGVRVTRLDELTGLAEYRNGGLFLDGGVIRARHEAALGERHAVGSPLIVEWRALTLALLDRTAAELRGRLGVGPAELPLAKVLEGGTWAAGRELALERRPGGGPPLEVESDGTVF